MKGTKSESGQKKLGVRRSCHAMYRKTAKQTRRSIAEVAQLAIECYREQAGLDKPNRQQVTANV